MNTNLNELVVAIYARGAMDRRETGTSDLGVAASKIRNNIRHGKAVDPVEGIPSKYIPDFAALQAQEKTMGEDAFVQAWTAMNARRQELYTELCKLWEAGEYDHMVRLMTEYTPMPLVEDGNE